MKLNKMNKVAFCDSGMILVVIQEARLKNALLAAGKDLYGSSRAQEAGSVFVSKHVSPRLESNACLGELCYGLAVAAAGIDVLHELTFRVFAAVRGPTGASNFDLGVRRDVFLAKELLLPKGLAVRDAPQVSDAAASKGGLDRLRDAEAALHVVDRRLHALNGLLGSVVRGVGVLLDVGVVLLLDEQAPLVAPAVPVGLEVLPPRLLLADLARLERVPEPVSLLLAALEVQEAEVAPAGRELVRAVIAALHVSARALELPEVPRLKDVGSVARDQPADLRRRGGAS